MCERVFLRQQAQPSLKVSFAIQQAGDELTGSRIRKLTRLTLPCRLKTNMVVVVLETELGGASDQIEQFNKFPL